MTRSSSIVAAAAVLLAACAVEGEVTNPEEDSVPDLIEGPPALGPNMQGPNMQGPNMQGPNMQGPNMQGPNMQGVDLTGRKYVRVETDSFVSGIQSISNLYFDDGVLRGTVEGTRFTSPKVRSIGAGDRFELLFGPRIPYDYSPRTVWAYIQDAYDYDGIRYYTIEMRDDDGNYHDVCSGVGSATLTEGTWSSGGDWSAGGITLACENSAVVKCMANWGYRPWAPNAWNPVRGTSVSQRDLLSACTRGTRADYRGNGSPHTEDGTLVDLYDESTLNGPLSASDWASSGLKIEAVYGPRVGALAVTKWRHDQLEAEGVTLSSDTIVLNPGQALDEHTLCNNPNFLAKIGEEAAIECLLMFDEGTVCSGSGSTFGAWVADYCSGALIFVASAEVYHPDNYSDRSCTQLGWGVGAYDGGSAECAESNGGFACTSNVGWFRAAEECEAIGARLCTKAELKAGAGENSGCGHNSRYIWSSTGCATPDGWPGRYLVYGKSAQGSYKSEVTCANPLQHIFGGFPYGRESAVRCCGDYEATFTFPK